MFEHKIHKALSKKAYNCNTFQQDLYFKHPRHLSDSMCELPPKKPNIEEKKPKSRTFFWRQRPLKKAKFVKSGVEKPNLATLSLFAFSSQEGLWRTAGSCSGVSSVFEAVFGCQNDTPKFCNDTLNSESQNMVMPWSETIWGRHVFLHVAMAIENRRMQCYRPTQFSGTEFGNENRKYGIGALSWAPPRFGLSLSCRRFVQYGERNCESNIMQL